jgi:hypothetical protein
MSHEVIKDKDKRQKKFIQSTQKLPMDNTKDEAFGSFSFMGSIKMKLKF